MVPHPVHAPTYGYFFGCEVRVAFLILKIPHGLQESSLFLNPMNAQRLHFAAVSSEGATPTVTKCANFIWLVLACINVALSKPLQYAISTFSIYKHVDAICDTRSPNMCFPSANRRVLRRDDRGRFHKNRPNPLGVRRGTITPIRVLRLG